MSSDFTVQYNYAEGGNNATDYVRFGAVLAGLHDCQRKTVRGGRTAAGNCVRGRVYGARQTARHDRSA